VSIDDTKLVEPEGLAPAFFLLPSQVERRVRMLPGLLLQGAVAKHGCEIKDLLARYHGTVRVSHDPAYMGRLGQHPPQPGPVVEYPGLSLSLP
jgi:hypothetical protein